MKYLLKKDKKNIVLAVRTGVCLLSLVLSVGCASMQPDSLLKLGTEVNSGHGKKARIHEIKGDEAAGSGDTNTALVEYVLSLDADSKQPDVLFKVGTIHRMQGNYVLARQSFLKSLNTESNHVPSMEGMGLVLIDMDQPEKAREYLEKVIEANEYSIDSLNALGILDDLSEQFESARSHYNKALEIKPKSRRILNNLGYSYYLDGNYYNAESYFKRVLDIDAEYERSWANLALVYLKLNEVNRARNAFDNIVEGHQSLNNIGYLRALNGEIEEAEKLFRESASVSPSYYSVANQNLRSLSVGSSPLDLSASGGVSIFANESLKSSRNNNESTLNSSVVLNAVPIADSFKVSSLSLKNSVIKFSSSVQQAQSILTEKGYQPGPVDGKLGVKTRSAIKQFQLDNDMNATGELSDIVKSLLKS